MLDSAEKIGHVLATWPKQPQLPVAVNSWKQMVEQRGIEPLTSALRMGKIAHCIFWHWVTCSDITYNSSTGCSRHRSKFLCSFWHRFTSICRESSDESVTFLMTFLLCDPLQLGAPFSPNSPILPLDGYLTINEHRASWICKVHRFAEFSGPRRQRFIRF